MSSLADVNESAWSSQFDLRRAADIDIALGTDLHCSKEALVKPASVVEVKLSIHLDDGIGIGGWAKFMSKGRKAAKYSCELI